ncbi:hypothetical protein PoB_005311700 [Plakobranchus ocellatus]|uniref:Uncharacterized protein n=1 Tax=Plakobranchus ocellatus TaxID=259542 RepID=A0AAV4C5R2_9GAST|nr:hypothetical protein PoB_005311700 [Plakobranchus ocellatus]
MVFIFLTILLCSKPGTKSKALFKKFTPRPGARPGAAVLQPQRPSPKKSEADVAVPVSGPLGAKDAAEGESEKPEPSVKKSWKQMISDCFDWLKNKLGIGRGDRP